MDSNAQDALTATPPKGEILQYGGQAVIEGVMMRSPRYFAVACRAPDGEIIVQREEIDKSALRSLKWMNKPFLRGTYALLDAMILGMKALAFASNVQLQGAHAQLSPPEKTPPHQNELFPNDLSKNGASKNGSHPALETEIKAESLAASASMVNGPPTAARLEMPASGKINDVAVKGTMASSLVFGVGFFVLLPTLLTGLGQHFQLLNGFGARGLNVVDGLIRMGLFFGYIGLISFLPAIHAVFQYHGAEHKAINALEAGLPLTQENALASSRIHPRCGTSFIFIVMAINIAVFSLLPRPGILLRFPLHIAMIPIVAGISYEVLKFAGKFRRNPLVMAVFAPGMWSQYLTTREPDPAHVEVSLAALRSVLEAEGHLKPLSQQTANPDEPAAAIA